MGAKLLLSTVGDSSVVNSTVETSFFNQTVPAGTLSTNNLLIIRMCAKYLNNTATPHTYTIRVKFGGTTIHTFTSLAQAVSVDSRACLTVVFLGGENATNSQRSLMQHVNGGTNSGALHANAGGNDHNTSTNGGIAVDSTADQTLEITVQLDTADANFSWTRQGVWVEKWDSVIPSALGDGTKLLGVAIDTGTVRNTTTATSVLSFTIPGGTLSTSNLLMIQLIGDVKNNTGGNAQWFADMYYGGTQILFGAGVANASDPVRYGFPIEVWLGGGGATNAQVVGILGHAAGGPSGGQPPFGNGEGNMPGAGWQAHNVSGTIAVDSTVDQTFELRIKFDTASPDLDYRMLAATFSVIKA